MCIVGTITVPMIASFDESVGTVQVCATLTPAIAGDTTERDITVTLATSDDTG